MLKTYALLLSGALGIAAFAVPLGTASAASGYYQQAPGKNQTVGRSQHSSKTWNKSNSRSNRRRGGWNNNSGDNNWSLRRHHRGFDETGGYIEPLILGGDYGYYDDYEQGRGFDLIVIYRDLTWCSRHHRRLHDSWRSNGQRYVCI